MAWMRAVAVATATGLPSGPAGELTSQEAHVSAALHDSSASQKPPGPGRTEELNM